mmetsp:Transcript_2893/g.11709  ORF Transcript_2893/g.11709 Transcript_2893/m.11709 type:complete len:208 (+) Transcript_2893:59-682(+)
MPLVDMDTVRCRDGPRPCTRAPCARPTWCPAALGAIFARPRDAPHKPQGCSPLRPSSPPPPAEPLPAEGCVAHARRSERKHEQPPPAGARHRILDLSSSGGDLAGWLLGRSDAAPSTSDTVTRPLPPNGATLMALLRALPTTDMIRSTSANTSKSATGSASVGSWSRATALAVWTRWLGAQLGCPTDPPPLEWAMRCSIDSCSVKLL